MKEDKILNEISKIIKEKLNEKEEKKISVIDMDKLTEIAHGIELVCQGEYGSTYVNEEENKIAICLGDSNMFDMEMLEGHLPYEVTEGYKDAELIDCEVDCEWIPNTRDGGWKEFKRGKWNDCPKQEK